MWRAPVGYALVVMQRIRIRQRPQMKEMLLRGASGFIIFTRLDCSAVLGYRNNTLLEKVLFRPRHSRLAKWECFLLDRVRQLEQTTSITRIGYV